ncbi:histone chaperone asf1 isoform X1 [Condylostylus longicornis]|uniref:histone chaperone asf1 isoform X1 n=2 Tax=Condylostylus longicornis TaxID=2530218 RepID=UPI00244DD405|nr:histone chaperone asf1 isoform X1 [Condylostylus longicornis]
MAKVHITNVVVLDNPSSFFNPFQFELTFECIEELREDLEWKMIYVGSAESEEYDQILDTIYVGPVPEGRHIFVFQAEAPDVTKIPEQDAVGVTIILLTCSYRGQEFVRVGYFVNNDYGEQELRENPPQKPQFEKLTRNILATKPRVTRFKINWDDIPTSIQGFGDDINLKEQISTNSETKLNDGTNCYTNENISEPSHIVDENSLIFTLDRTNDNSNSLLMEC